jgi:hypothetical protein
MVEVLEKSERRLRLKLSGAAMSVLCTLDLEKNVAEVARTALSIPYRRERIPLSSVFGISVRKRSRRKIYENVFDSRVGEPMKFGSYSKEDALEAARAIREFLRVNKIGIGLARADAGEAPA